MESLITSKTRDDEHKEALDEDIKRTETLEAINKSLAKKYVGRGKARGLKTKEVVQPSYKGQIIRVDLPVDQLLAANHKGRKEFFRQLLIDIRARLAQIREERKVNRG